jgi:uncharacterized protein (DUF362 family)
MSTQQKSVVSIVKGTDASSMVEEALSLLGGVTSLIKPGSTVVVKPNAGHPHPPETSVNTSPAVVAAVIKELRKAQPKEIILAEAASIGEDTLECLELSGIGKAAEDAGVDRIVDLKREKEDLFNIPIRDARSKMTKIQLPRFMLEAEHLVNLPIFKTHVSMVFSCALKNMKGVVQDKQHHLMHMTDLAAAMMDLWSVVRADLTIADILRPGEGFGPHTTIPTDFGCIVAGKDPVAIDATMCRMVGVDIERVAYFEPARERGLGNFLEKDIEIRGRTINEVFQKLWIPYLGGFGQWPEYNILAEGACSSCQGLLAYTMEKLKAMDEYDKHEGISIVIGPKKKLPEKVKPGKDLILVGDCTKKYRDQGLWVPGCPPHEPEPFWAIIDERTYDGPEDMDFDLRARMAEEAKIFKDYMKNLKDNSKGKKP